MGLRHLSGEKLWPFPSKALNRRKDHGEELTCVQAERGLDSFMGHPTVPDKTHQDQRELAVGSKGWHSSNFLGLVTETNRGKDIQPMPYG